MDLFLGGAISPDGERGTTRTTYDPSDLTTHGVIVGMTGSGKTGLGIIYLEEALRNGIPCLVIDPKGDMTNLMLTFPDLAPGDFLPWMDRTASQREGMTPEEAAEGEAERWRKGLASWDLSGTDISALRSTVGMTIYTPGSDAGVPVDVVGDLRAPSLSWDTDAETIRAEIQGFVSGLLGLVDIDADPISSREHILLANLIEHAWSAGRDLTLEILITQIVAPPIRKLGVFEVDAFFPEADRMRLAMQLNGLLASPSFAAWMQGEPLDIPSLLWRDDRPQAAILYLAHLSDAERQFVVTAVLSKLITWMRSQPGSSELRVLTYMDEVFGFAPPTAQPPAKLPILTLLKQARAFGVGMLLSTQNPVDLDYKAMSNAGTWCIGRLQTERDKARILEGLSAASGDVDLADIDRRISGLGKRQFVLHTTHRTQPELFTTRWAMSYLRGPMTREEVARATGASGQAARAASPSQQPKVPEQPPTAPPAPEVAEGIAVYGLDPAAPWGERIGADPKGDHLEAAVALTVTLRFDETRAGIDHTETWEAVAHPLTADPGAMTFVEVDHDERDFIAVDTRLPASAPEAPISQSSWFEKLERVLRERLDRTEELTLLRNRPLALVARPGESDDDFHARCHTAATDGADAAMAKQRDRFATKFRTAQRAYDKAVREADTASAALDDVTGDTILDAGLDLLMGRRPRVSSTGNRSASARLRKAEDKVEDARIAFEDVGRELEDELRGIADAWDARAADVEPITVGLEADDIDIVEIRIVWIPRSHPDTEPDD